MNETGWIIAGIAGAIILVASVVLTTILVRDRLRAERDRTYKTLRDHSILNASSREEWMSGRLARRDPAHKDEEELGRLNTVVISVAQVAATVVVLVLLIIWHAGEAGEKARLDDRIAQLELQVHALATLPPPAAANAYPADSDFPSSGGGARGTPMQQACANLIGRVADAYQHGESSKIGQSLEALATRLGCMADARHE
jgi:hypothetical protein